MQFREFITRQRIFIFVFGLLSFTLFLAISGSIGFNTLWGELFIDLAASSVTIIFTALIIDYLGQREQSNKTKSAANLAEDEIRTSCYRIKWRLARLYGLDIRPGNVDNISNLQEARDYLEKATKDVDDYLSKQSFEMTKTKINKKAFPVYVERLQTAQNELEQTLILYEYALSYSLREYVLALRRELQTAERLLGFIDTSEPFNKANLSLIQVTAQSVYEATQSVLEHESRSSIGSTIHSKQSSTSLSS